MSPSSCRSDCDADAPTLCADAEGSDDAGGAGSCLKALHGSLLAPALLASTTSSSSPSNESTPLAPVLAVAGVVRLEAVCWLLRPLTVALDE